MSGQKQSFRFRLPWLPSPVSAPPPPPPPPPPSADMIPIQMHIEDLESESPYQAIRPLAQPESQITFPIANVQSHLPPQVNQQQLTEAATPRVITDSRSPYGQLEAASQNEPTEFHITLSGTDSTPLQLSGRSSAPVQATESHGAEFQHLPKTEYLKPPGALNQQASPTRDFQPLSPSQGAKSQHLRKTESPKPSGAVAQQASPTRESKPLPPSQGAKLIQPKSHLSSSSATAASSSSSPSSSPSSSSPSSSSSWQKTSPTRAKYKPCSPSQTGNLTRANSKLLSPSDAGNHKRTAAKEPLPSHGATHTRNPSLPPVPSHTAKFIKTSSRSSSSSPPFSPSSQSSPSYYSTGESSNLSNKQPTSSPKDFPIAPTSKPKTHASQEYEHKSTSAQEETKQPDTIKSSDSEAIQANRPVTVYDKMAPEPSHAMQMKEVIATRLTEHPSTDEVSDTEDTLEEESHKSARNKRKRKLFLKRVSPSSRNSVENRLTAHHSHRDEGQSNIPLHKEIKNDVSNFIEKLSLGKLGQSRSEDHPVSIITISGDNKGATLHLNRKAASPMSAANSDSDGTKGGPCINSKIQSINNSMLLSSSVHERNPGVHHHIRP